VFRRRMSRLLAALVLLLGTTLTVVVPAGPAQASGLVECIEFQLANGQRILHCWVIDVPDVPRWPQPPECLPCDFVIDFDILAVLPPDAVFMIGRGLAEGLADGLAARRATDPKQAAQWRVKELAAYSAAAGKLGQAKLNFAGVSPAAGDPEPQPNIKLLAEYGGLAVRGLDLLRAGDTKGALAAFDDAAGAYEAALFQG
jgi:hypothetical protein